VFPTEFVDSRDDDRLASIRGVLWCVVCEAAICIVVTVGWGLWLCFKIGGVGTARGTLGALESRQMLQQALEQGRKEYT
jgi:hypothetical protein